MVSRQARQERPGLEDVHARFFRRVLIEVQKSLPFEKRLLIRYADRTDPTDFAAKTLPECFDRDAGKFRSRPGDQHRNGLGVNGKGSIQEMVVLFERPFGRKQTGAIGVDVQTMEGAVPAGSGQERNTGHQPEGKPDCGANPTADDFIRRSA